MGNMAQMQQQMMNNPEMMRQMMDSPLMQNLLNNPDIFRALLSENPQIQQLVEVFKSLRVTSNTYYWLFSAKS
jgi:ubiquilin